MKKLLSIAGSDCSGGAGIQADLKTFAAHFAFGMSVITAVVAENTRRVISMEEVAPDLIRDQITAVFEDMGADGVKVGLLPGAEAILAVAEKLREYQVQNAVIDPVMVAKGGHPLSRPEALETLKREIVPLAFVLTPNLPEAEALTGLRIETTEDMERAARRLYEMGAKNVLVKGGHLEGDALDLLYDGAEYHRFSAPRLNTKNTHGTGCTLSSALAANLAHGMPLTEAVAAAKRYVTEAIAQALPIGKGHGPLNHFYRFQDGDRQGSRRQPGQNG